MSERFKVVHLRNYCSCDIQDTEQDILTFYNDLGDISSVQPVCDLLNQQDHLIKTLKDENNKLKQLLSQQEE